jgi:hypothetical protein
MELMDTFAKYDLAIDQSCKRYEATYYQMAKELDKKLEPLQLEFNVKGGG